MNITTLQIFQEIEEVIGNSFPSLTHRENMHFTQAFMQELFRYRPLVPLALPHTITNTIDTADYTIPKVKYLHS